MKKCPRCGKGFDDGLNFCLDDGEILINDDLAAESKTANLPALDAATKKKIDLAAQTAILPPSLNHKQRPMTLSKRTAPLFAALAAVLIIGGFFGYKYLFSSKQINSIAVLPFENKSGDPDSEYLSDGLTESLIFRLSQVSDLKVSPRSSVFRYKGKETDVLVIANELGVDAVMTGKVVQRGDNLTISVDLVDVRYNKSLWGEQLERKTADLLATQREIAAEITNKLQLKLSNEGQQKLAKQYTTNNEAYQLFLKGRYHRNKLTPPEIKLSLDYYQRAIDADPNFALAYAEIGFASFALSLTADAPPHEVFPKAREATLKALKIDDNLADAHSTLGWIKMLYDWDWPGSEQEFRRAMELNPNDANILTGYSHLLTLKGKFNEALEKARRASELEPLNLRINALEGQALFFAEKYDESSSRLQKTIELERNFWLSHLFLCRFYIVKEMYDAAIAEAIMARDFSGGNSETIAHLIYALAKAGRTEEARANLNDFEKRASERFVPPYCLALAFNGLGETDQAIAALEKGIELRDPRMTFLNIEPKWNNLRNDPRFQNIVRRVGLP